MSRSGYSDDCENLNLYRATVARAIHGKRGQALLQKMAAALDGMPVRELADGVLRRDEQVCALGAVAVAHGIDVSELDETDSDAVGKTFDVARSMAAEIAYVNDECGPWKGETPAQRWTRVRAWVSENLWSGPEQVMK